ncbi:RagB/SusD family nutrient uptake outer membrane protein [Galbibacter sp. EGI 63066]|uniref:RagB/SusD family nutrient uptake outer membrane protein n=1 Tax=Galbibacter sp. EGI 63066 TaxID=2993559 RepID=UPI00224949FE|nr:RagB/SusD family nutrient uptake outer membrane protein [Galbibacter sp. EGI 63066]MCX2680974.1 RagB/SusD family nutrient uptake outer membrane protein [Galbibacter sp. EGI 63066]
MKYILIQYKKLHRYIIIILVFSISYFYVSCENFLDIEPPKDELVSDNVYTSDPVAALKGMYSEIMDEHPFGGGGEIFNSIHAVAGRSADELDNYSNIVYEISISDNTLTPTNLRINSIWEQVYKYVYYTNSILEGLPNSVGILSETEKNQFEGEAKFIRAFCYFYLVNLWGDVPLITTTDYQANAVASRTPQTQVYEQIIEDLKEAQNLMAEDYSFSEGEKVRPNRWAATALLARVYLYIGDWAGAEAEANTVINNTTYSLSADLNSVFLANSPEAIWQLLPIQPGFNTTEGRFYILTSTPTRQTLSDYTLNAFEAGDQRRANWIDSITVDENTYYYPYKYKVQSGATLTEYSMVLRLAEQYLIRAEARTQQNNLFGAQADLNIIRERAGLPDTDANTQATLLEAIEHERRVEFFTEWGHRWLDLKRTGRADKILGNIKPNWQSSAVLFPIPQAEIDKNSNLTQNPGY